MVWSTLKTVTAMVLGAFPNTPIVPVYGNNDVPYHYVTPLGPRGAPWMAQVRGLWEPVATCAGCAAGAIPADFSVWDSTGAYSVAPYAGLRVVALNTLLFGPFGAFNLSQSGGAAGQAAAAETMLAWFRATITRAASTGERLLVTSHMPPGMQPFNDKPVWNSTWQGAYASAVLAAGPIVVGQLFGHFHFDDFRLLTLPGGSTVPVMLAPSVSPVYYNNPAFRDVYLDPATSAVTNYVQHYADLPASNAGGAAAWAKEYSFTDLYGVAPDAAGYGGLPARMAADSRLYGSYLRHHYALYAPFPHHYICAMALSGAEEYHACVKAGLAYDRHDVCLPVS